MLSVRGRILCGLTLALAAGCSSGSTFTVPAKTAVPATAAPATAAPATAAPSTAPSASPSPVATATPITEASPSPSPTATATAGTSAVIVFNPTYVSMPNSPSDCPTSSYTQSFSASEAGYSGAFSAVSDNTSLVSVNAPTTSSGNFSLTAPAAQSTSTKTTVTVTDILGNHAAIQVTFNLICLP